MTNFALGKERVEASNPEYVKQVIPQIVDLLNRIQVFTETRDLRRTNENRMKRETLLQLNDKVTISDAFFFLNFKFEAVKYPGALDPILDDKPVLVIAIKDNPEGKVLYSFLDMTELMDEENPSEDKDINVKQQKHCE